MVVVMFLFNTMFPSYKDIFLMREHNPRFLFFFLWELEINSEHKNIRYKYIPGLCFNKTN